MRKPEHLEKCKNLCFVSDILHTFPGNSTCPSLQLLGKTFISNQNIRREICSDRTFGRTGRTCLCVYVFATAFNHRFIIGCRFNLWHSVLVSERVMMQLQRWKFVFVCACFCVYVCMHLCKKNADKLLTLNAIFNSRRGDITAQELVEGKYCDNLDDAESELQFYFDIQFPRFAKVSDTVVQCDFVCYVGLLLERIETTLCTTRHHTTLQQNTRHSR